MADGKIKKGDLLEQGAVEDFNRLDEAILKNVDSLTQLLNLGRKASSSGAFTPLSKETTETVKKTNAALTEYEKIIRETTRLQERNSAANREALSSLAAERAQRTQLNKELREEAILSGRLGDAYRRLRIQRDRAANSLRNLVASEKASNAELRKAQREFDRLDNQVRKADRAIGNFRDNVGNYGSAVRNVTAFTLQFAGALGILSTVEVVRGIFETTKEIDSLRLGLEQVTESTEEFNETQEFLATVSERAGVNLLDITKRYVNLRAAAKTTNLTLDQTRDIFDAIVSAGALLGRTQDDVNGALRATEQILSKGTVQAEEIRGQLGERLPGAFQILEQALGLANGELNEFLEVGGVLSVEAIPALSRGLESTFNTQLNGRVETLEANTQRLQNAVEDLVNTFSAGDGPITRFFNTILEGATRSVKFFANLGKSTEEIEEAFNRAASQEQFTNTLRAINKEAESSEKSIVEVARAYRGDFLNSVNLAKSRIQALEEEQAELNKTTGGTLFGFSKQEIRLKELNKQLEEQRRNLALYQGGIDAVNSVLRKNSDEVSFNTDKLEENAKQQKLIIDFFQFYSETTAGEVLKFYKDLRDSVDVGTSEWFEYNEELRRAEESLKAIVDQRQILNGDLGPIEFIEEGEDPFADVQEFLSGAPLDSSLETLANRLKSSKEDIVAEFESLYERDFSKFVEYEEEKVKQFNLLQRQRRQTFTAGLDFIDSLNETYLQLQLERIEAEEEKSIEAFENVSNNKESSVNAIEIAEIKRAEQEKRLEEERVRAEQNAFIFRQALAVGDIFLADSVARARALAATAGIIPVALGLKTLALLNAAIAKQTAFSLASVAAQTVPAFFYKGKPLGDNYEGPGVWGEYRREARITPEGLVEISPDRPTLTHVGRDDLILKSIPDFKAALGNPNSEAFKRISGGVEKRTKDRLQIVSVGGAGVDNKGIQKAVERGMAKFANRPNNITIVNRQKRRRYT